MVAYPFSLGASKGCCYACFGVLKKKTKKKTSDASQPAVAQVDISPGLSVVVGAVRGPQVSDTLA